MPNYTESEIADVKKREQQGLDALKMLGLTPACMPQLVNLGNDTFGIKLLPYLQDTKFSPQKSPIQV